MEFRNQLNSLTHEKTTSNNVSELHSSENVLGKKLKSKHVSWLSAQTIELLNINNKPPKVTNVHATKHKIYGKYCKDKYQQPLTKTSKDSMTLI